MKRSILTTILMIGILAVFGADKVSAQTGELEAVKIQLENYLLAQKTGKAEYMKKVLHTEGKLMFIRDGKLKTIEFKDYLELLSGREAADEAERRRYIESIEITGDVAVGKLVLDYPAIKFTDYMTLLKFDGEWKIVNKAAYSVRKERAK